MNKNNFPQPTRWWWVRHAPVVDAVPAVRISGQLDVDANTGDVAAFKALAERLPNGARWITSNLKRTRQTAAAIINAGINISGDITSDELLAEQDFGGWAGMTWEELGTLESGEGAGFWQAPATTRPPGGESFADVMARAHPAIERHTNELAHDNGGGDIVCVAHAGTIRAALALALELSPEKALSFNVDNLSITRIEHIEGGLKLKRGGHWRVAAVNW